MKGIIEQVSLGADGVWTANIDPQRLIRLANPTRQGGIFMVELTAAHWVYAFFIVLILLTMALKRETPIVCVVGSLILSWVITGNIVKAVQAMHILVVALRPIHVVGGRDLVEIARTPRARPRPFLRREPPLRAEGLGARAARPCPDAKSRRISWRPLPVRRNGAGCATGKAAVAVLARPSL